jgi:predicted acetyltransferase
MKITELDKNSVGLDSWGNPSASPQRKLYLKTQPTMFTVDELTVKYAPSGDWPSVYALDDNTVAFVLELYKTYTTVYAKDFPVFQINSAHTAVKYRKQGLGLRIYTQLILGWNRNLAAFDNQSEGAQKLWNRLVTTPGISTWFTDGHQNFWPVTAGDTEMQARGNSVYTGEYGAGVIATTAGSALDRAIIRLEAQRETI